MGKFKQIFFVTLLICLLLIGVIRVSAQSNLLSNSTDKHINVGLYLLNLGKFDIATGSFTADFYLSLKCDNICPNQDFEFMNGRAITFEKIIDRQNEKFYRIQANLVSPIDLKRFPFDKQKLEIIIEDKKNTIDNLNYIPNLKESGIDKSIIFIGWNIDEWTAYVREHNYEIYDLKRFPFDKQKLEIIIEDKKNTIDNLNYIPNLKESG